MTVPPALALSGWLYYSSLNAADLASTARAEHRGGTEQNPLLGKGWPQRVAVKAAVTAAEAYIDHQFPPKRRWVPRALFGGLMGYLIVHNLRQHPAGGPSR